MGGCYIGYIFILDITLNRIGPGIGAAKRRAAGMTSWHRVLDVCIRVWPIRLRACRAGDPGAPQAPPRGRAALEAPPDTRILDTRPAGAWPRRRRTTEGASTTRGGYLAVGMSCNCALGHSSVAHSVVALVLTPALEFSVVHDIRFAAAGSGCSAAHAPGRRQVAACHGDPGGFTAPGCCQGDAPPRIRASA